MARRANRDEWAGSSKVTRQPALQRKVEQGVLTGSEGPQFLVVGKRPQKQSGRPPVDGQQTFGLRLKIGAGSHEDVTSEQSQDLVDVLESSETFPMIVAGHVDSKVD
jgi:hypothetical protein